MSKKLLMSNKLRAADNAYSHFVFRIEDVELFGTIKLVGEGSEDTPTDWGDKTADSKTSHTYSNPGIYTVKTKLRINDTKGNGDDLTKRLLIMCLHIDNTVSDMQYFFYNCTSLLNVDLSRPRVMTNKIYSMFFGCSALTELDISSLDTTNVVDMSFAFSGCEKLTYLDLSHFDFSNVVSMSYMFDNCHSLTELNISSFSAYQKGKTYMSGMFCHCYRLKTIIGELDLSTVSYMGKGSGSMFYGCASLETLYLKNIYTKRILGGSVTNSPSWSIDLGGTKVKDECLLNIISRLPDLSNVIPADTYSNIDFVLPKNNTLTEEDVKVAKDKRWDVENTNY